MQWETLIELFRIYYNFENSSMVMPLCSLSMNVMRVLDGNWFCVFKPERAVSRSFSTLGLCVDLSELLPGSISTLRYVCTWVSCYYERSPHSGCLQDPKGNCLYGTQHCINCVFLKSGCPMDNGVLYQLAGNKVDSENMPSVSVHFTHGGETWCACVLHRFHHNYI